MQSVWNGGKMVEVANDKKFRSISLKALIPVIRVYFRGLYQKPKINTKVQYRRRSLSAAIS